MRIHLDVQLQKKPGHKEVTPMSTRETKVENGEPSLVETGFLGTMEKQIPGKNDFIRNPGYIYIYSNTFIFEKYP